MMRPMKRSRKTLAFVISTMILGVNMSACSMDNTWKEEVVLHGGKKLIIERSTSTNLLGNREIGQSAPKSGETLRFSPPGKSLSISWHSEFGPDFQDNLTLLALDFLNGTPYIVTYPNCFGYNKWGRPNPPYVIFKFDGQAWQRTTVDQLPKGIGRANALIGGFGDHERSQLLGMGIAAEKTRPYVLAEVVDQFNEARGGDPGDLVMRVIHREPLKDGGMNCPEMVYYKGAWVGPGDSIGRQVMDRKTQ